MPNMNKPENVKEQYTDDKNLSIRIKLHQKYSTNKQGFIPWLFEQYQFAENNKILELGCGNGNQWEGRAGNLPSDCKLILSDLSDGMVDIVRNKYSKLKNILFEQIDIQNIDYPNESFDIIIANHMLYHIPDIAKALTEVKRVLKTGGKFYAATNGNGGMHSFLHNAMKQIDPDTKAFTEKWSFNLQDGAEILKLYFTDVKKIEYTDSLSVTETQDLMDWIKSTISIASYSENDIDGLYDNFEEIRIREGAIDIPKEVGLFVSIK